jgi:hypothetical protein
MAEAREKLAIDTALERITIPEAIALLVDEGLDPDEARLLLTGALLKDKLRGGDLEGPGKFRELGANLQDLCSGGAMEPELKAIRRLSSGLSIPWESWFKWIGDGSVDWKNSEIARDVGSRIVIFTPAFRREEVLALVPRFESNGKAARESIHPDTPPSAATTGPQSSAIRPNLTDAPIARIRDALRRLYSDYETGEAPNINQVVRPVQDLLAIDGYKASKQHIQNIAAAPEFKRKRREVDKHRNQTASLK